jgi:SAM-dependent methyltransferase
VSESPENGADAGKPFTDRLYNGLRRVLMPSLRNSQSEYAERLHAESARGRRWLDVGCGHDVVPPWASAEARGLAPDAGVDPDISSIARNSRVRWRVGGQGEQLPFASGSFDLVTANMVLEHVAAPERLFDEVARVLKPGGRFVVHTPNANGYTTLLTKLIPEGLRAPIAGRLHGRASNDVYPTHYRANTAAVLQTLAAGAGFSRSAVEYVHSSPQLIRVPPLLVAEMLLIRALSTSPLQQYRACLIAAFERGAAPSHARD